MPSLATAYVDINVNKTPLTAGLNSVRSDLTKFVSESNRIMSGLTMTLGITGAGGIGAGLYKAAKMAADLEETMSKVQATFGSAAQGMIDQSDELAEKFGVIKQASLDASAMFGILGKSAGMASYEAAKFGQEFVKIGVDLSSFYDMSTSMVFEKMLSGMEGMPRPLRDLGIFINEDKIKAEALAMGLMKVNHELTEGEKLMARASLIRKEAGIALGDAERTAMSTARQLEKAIGDATNAFVAFGEKLKPTLIEAIGLMKDLGETFRKMFGESPDKAIAGGLKRIIENVRDVIRKTPGDVEAIKKALEFGSRQFDLRPMSLRSQEEQIEDERRSRMTSAEDWENEKIAEPDSAKVMRSVRKVESAVEDFVMKYVKAWNTVSAQESEAQVWRGMAQIRGLMTAGRNIIGGGIGQAGQGLANIPGFFSDVKGERGLAFQNIVNNPMLKMLGIAQPLGIAGALGGSLATAARKRMEPGEGGTFTDVSQYAQYAQQKALEDHLQKEQNEILKASREKLGEIAGILNQMLNGAVSGAKAIIPRAIGG